MFQIDENDEMEWQTSALIDQFEEVVNEAVEELSLPHAYKTFFLHHVCPDLEDMNHISKKEKSRKYVTIYPVYTYHRNNIHAVLKSKKFKSY